MKKLILLSLLTLQFGLLAAQNADGQGRLSHLFNFGWKLIRVTFKIPNI